MRRLFAISIIACALAALAHGQQGGFGGGQGGGMGGMQMGQQGQGQRQWDGSVQSIDAAISQYLNTEELKSVLTPGEYCEWTVNLKAGQVVISEARSDAFDPALEMVDDKGKVLASNDDRYPGDQRPLLLWRCDHDGAYALHVRCFHDKSGGQVFVRFKTYDSIDVTSDETTDHEVDRGNQFLMRIPMKAGSIKEILSMGDTDHRYYQVRAEAVISESGLPDISLAQPLQPVTPNTLVMAPVSGDYYVLADANGGENGRSKVRIWTRELAPKPLTKEGSGYSAEAKNNLPTLWEIPVKAGDFVEISTPELSLNCRLVLAEEPDISKFDISKPETDPFFPRTSPTSKSPPFDVFPARARDGRITVFYVQRDAKLWVGSNGAGPADKEFTLEVKPAAADFVEDRSIESKLRIGDTDYWAIQAKAGDVMTLNTRASSFSEQVLVRDPGLSEIRHWRALPDQTSDQWRMIVQKPGRYLLAVSCLGDGGGGGYSIERKVFHAKEFSMTSPARGEISNGELQIWRFTATPDKPLFIHWNSSSWDYDIAIYNDKGQPTDFQRMAVDDHNVFGMLKVEQPETYVIVLTGRGPKSSYDLELGDIPGYKPAAKAR